MARILFTWELGGALGHLTSIRSLADHLLQLGHEIHLAVRNTIFVAETMHGLAVTFHAIPNWRTPKTPLVNPVHTFAHVLHNVGYRDSDELATLLRSWQSILHRVKPHLMVCEASPTALLAARGSGIPIVHVGTGYAVPPESYPLPDICFWNPADPESSRSDEDALTSNINRALDAIGSPPLLRLPDLFDAKLTALWTVKELDHYRNRSTDNYVGSIAQLPGDQPPWPAVSGPRVFAYLKPFPELPQLLQQLQRRRVCALIYGPTLPPEIATRFHSENLHFTAKPINISYVSRSAALAITNAGHSLALEMLLAGVPLLCFPILLEQHVLARNIDALGGGKYCSPWRSDRIGKSLDALLDEPSYKAFAQAFANRYSRLQASEQAASLAARISALVV
jgi:UDP-N-acetylglucosamine:LPS N-acetylglucosamine transferase